MQEFKKESEFEQAIIDKLTKDMNQWRPEILEYKSEDELIANWKSIIEKNNCERDRLNSTKLTDSEMKQILNYFDFKSPFEINKFLNGDPSIRIVRDNPEDKEHYEKQISLKLFNKKHIAGGNSIYQIARQVKFKTNYSFKSGNRGDITLLINGMPLIHIELKNNCLDKNKINESINQIKRYKKENVFTGFFSLVQLFVVMTPTEMRYFTNVNSWDEFNDRYMFEWANKDNEPIRDWKEICKSFLSIPMAHNMISFYSVADETDKTLKVLRSYQCYAAEKIFNITLNWDWESRGDTRGGYVYHTTGSGKTLTCFKVAQLLNNFTQVDKIVFLLDAIQLYEQTYNNFNAFSVIDSIEDTKNVHELATLLNSSNKTKKIIITSIQKMKDLTDINKENNQYQKAIDNIKNKKVVFIVDEAHRSTNGSMLADIKNTYKRSLLFGFTGTPIFEENSKDRLTTRGLFGDELHRYTMLSAIRDGNVLEVKNTENITTYNLNDIKKDIAEIKFKENSDDYYNFIESTNQLTIESEYASILKKYYDGEIHKKIVINDIVKNFNNRSHNGFFHHILATTSIKNAIEYYRLFKTIQHDINIAITFDDNERNDETSIFKNDAMEEILSDYRNKYNKKHIFDFKSMKNDIIYNLKNQLEKEKRIDLVIVVDQLLTGFDSKFINYVYLDKVMEYEKLIQTVSRTNRILNHLNESKKCHGFLTCYQRTEVMKKNLEEAAKLFISPKNLNFFESKLKDNLLMINKSFEEIKTIFKENNIENFSKLPIDEHDRKAFAKLFITLKKSIDKSIPELFNWNQRTYIFNEKKDDFVNVEICKDEFQILQQRFIDIPKDEKDNFSIYIDINSSFNINEGYSLDVVNLNSLIHKFYEKNESSEIGLISNYLEKIKKEMALFPLKDQELINDLLNKIKSNEIEITSDFDIHEYLLTKKNEKKELIIKGIHKFSRISLDLLQELDNISNNSNSDLMKSEQFEMLKHSIDCNVAMNNFKKVVDFEIDTCDLILYIEEYVKFFLKGNDIDIEEWMKNKFK